VNILFWEVLIRRIELVARLYQGASVGEPVAKPAQHLAPFFCFMPGAASKIAADQSHAINH